MDTDDGDGGEGPARLDLSGYDERERALALAAHGCPDGYTAVARRHMAAASELSLDAFLFSGFVSRLRGLHEGVVREIAASNPHGPAPDPRVGGDRRRRRLHYSQPPVRRGPAARSRSG